VRRAIQAHMWAGPRMLLAGKLLSITSWGAGYYDGMYREAHGIDGIRNAVAAGVRTIEHGTYLHHDPRIMERMAAEGIFLVPTLKAIWELAENNRPGVPDWNGYRSVRR
jgi:hypothetical protein